MRILLAIVFLFLASVGFASWPNPKNEKRKELSPAEQWELSDTVVHGTIIEQKLLPAPFLESKYLSAVETKIRIKKKWKGKIEEDEVHSFYMLSEVASTAPLYKQFPRFDIGRDYVLFSQWDQKHTLSFMKTSTPMEESELVSLFPPKGRQELWKFLHERTK